MQILYGQQATLALTMLYRICAEIGNKIYPMNKEKSELLFTPLMPESSLNGRWLDESTGVGMCVSSVPGGAIISVREPATNCRVTP